MLNEIIAELGANYNTADYDVLNTILTKATTDALFISNRSNTTANVNLLQREIEDYTKAIYLQRGAEDVKSISQSGINSQFKDAYETLRNDIIKNGKRVIK